MTFYPPRDKELFRRLHKNIFFEKIVFPENYEEIVNAAVNRKWGIYVLPKLFGFKLIKEYENVLFLDSDIIITSDISEIFSYKELAWRKVLAWNPIKNFKPLIRNNDYISAGNGGVIYFSNKLNKYHINDDDITEAFEETKNLKEGGIDERILAYIAYKKNVLVEELDIIYNQPAGYIKPGNESSYKIIHFLDSRWLPTKPWKNLASYLYFKEWAENYEEWITMGGEGIVSFTEDNYYDLFGFKQADEINKLKNKLKQKEDDLKELKKYREKYNSISNSRTWKVTKPIRKILDIIKTVTYK